MDKKKLKVAFLSFYSGEVYRGVETYVYELANRLFDLGTDVTVYQNGPRLKNTRYRTVSTNFRVDWKEKGRSFKNFRIPLLDYYSRLVGKFTGRSLELIDEDTDFIITTNGGLQIFLTKFWSLTHKAKVIVVGQSGPGMDDRWNLWCFPDVFVSLTDFQRKWAKETNSLVKVVNIPNGVDLGRFSNQVKPLKIDLPNPVVLSVGALEEGKRLDLIIRAVQKTNFSLLLVGKGDLEEELNDMGKELLGERFKIISLPFDRMPQVYTSANLFTYPTVPVESFGIVLVEAMASGLPVVATDDPIRREIVGEAGLFVNPTDLEKYSKALEKASEIRWDGKPRKQAEKFDWDIVAKKYEELFNELVK